MMQAVRSTPPNGGIALLRRKANTLVGLPRFQKAWFIPAWVLLGIARLAILIVSFRRIAPALGDSAGIAAQIPLVSARQKARAQNVGDVVRLASKYTPWKSNCFPQAIVARLLLGWYGVPYALYFGLDRTAGGPNQMRAHAWICSGPVVVVGGRSFDRFTVVGTFVARDLIDPPNPRIPQ